MIEGVFIKNKITSENKLYLLIFINSVLFLVLKWHLSVKNFLYGKNKIKVESMQVKDIISMMGVRFDIFLMRIKFNNNKIKFSKIMEK